MDIREAIENYCPCCEQEARDKAVILSFIDSNSDAFERSNLIAHMTASAWVVNPARDKVLMVYHNIYDSWSWTGGHADGERDLLSVAVREVREETGLTMHTPVYRGIVDFYCDPWPAERILLYTCTDFSGVMTDCDEGCLEWVDKNAVQDLPIWQGDKIFFKLLAEDAPFFHLELTYEGDMLVKAVLDGEELL